MNNIKMHHVSIIVSDTEHSLTFYRDILGLTVSESRPEMSIPGVWLDVGGQQIHLLELPNPDRCEGRPEYVGHDRHLAFTVHGLDDLEDKLEQVGVLYTKSRSGRNVIFCRDPDGNGIELIAD